MPLISASVKGRYSPNILKALSTPTSIDLRPGMTVKINYALVRAIPDRRHAMRGNELE
jgi:hypothetical protein